MKRKPLTRKDFKRFYNDIHWANRPKPDLELALEPCHRGFDIALYYKKGRQMDLIGMKLCTGLLVPDDKLNDKDRSPEVWSEALKLANFRLDQYMQYYKSTPEIRKILVSAARKIQADPEWVDDKPKSTTEVHTFVKEKHPDVADQLQTLSRKQVQERGFMAAYVIFGSLMNE